MSVVTGIVLRQLKAMWSTTFEVGIKKQNGKMLIKTWNIQNILKSISYLQYENTNGGHIYIRPLGSTGLILLDDVNINTLFMLENDGFEPSVIIETSPQNYQVFIKISKQNIKPETATLIAQYLTKKYGADMCSADWKHFGRLAGFTNRKAEHVDKNGNFPFVKLTETNKILATSSSKLLNYISNIQLKKTQKIKQEYRLNLSNKSIKDLQDIFSKQVFFYETKYKSLGLQVNYSVIDWRIILTFIYADIPISDIKHVLKTSSPNLLERKKRHVDDYITRSINKALEFINQEEPLA